MSKMSKQDTMGPQKQDEKWNTVCYCGQTIWMLVKIQKSLSGLVAASVLCS